jgi:N-acetylglucosamine-6-phosphate deacetylase
MSLVLTNGRVFSESGVLSEGSVYIEEGVIRAIGRSGTPPADETVDVRGFSVCPGLIDIHTHGIFDADFIGGSVKSMMEGFEQYLRFGVTRVLPTTLSSQFDTVVEQVKKIGRARNKSPVGHMVHGVHVEGPWLAPRCKGGHPEKYLRVPNKQDVEQLLGESGELVKTVTFSPELDNAIWLCETLSANGIVPVIGHTAATYEKTLEAVRAGARHVTHLFDATLGIRESETEPLTMEPGMETAVLIHDAVSVELIGCPVHVPIPLFMLVNKVKPHDKKIIVSDSLIGAGRPDGTVVTFKDGRKALVNEGVLRMVYPDNPELDGNLTGSAVTLNTAVRRLSRFIGEPLEQAIRWATINPALLLGIQSETGSIRVGKAADIAVFDEDFNAKMTILGGKIVYRNGL